MPRLPRRLLHTKCAVATLSGASLPPAEMGTRWSIVAAIGCGTGLSLTLLPQRWQRCPSRAKMSDARYGTEPTASRPRRLMRASLLARFFLACLHGAQMACRYFPPGLTVAPHDRHGLAVAPRHVGFAGLRILHDGPPRMVTIGPAVALRLHQSHTVVCRDEALNLQPQAHVLTRWLRSCSTHRREQNT